MSTSNKLFKPEDFDALEWRTTWDNFQTKAASLANHILSEHLATLPRVYGVEHSVWGESEKSVYPKATHTALLWGITEIEKNCEHAPDVVGESHYYKFTDTCKYCGVKLKARWEKV